ncbi:MAG: nitroreductase family protein [Clostridia bacterium]|nr:nitroreductase family protein [Clostridia bacterium]
MNINDVLKSRRTIRKFKQTPLSGEQLMRYIDAARVAPSAANLQPLKYIAVKNTEMVEKIFGLVKWAGYLASEYNPKEDERPTAYIAVCADTAVRKAGYEIDVGAAVENLILSAFSDGVGACWMGAVDRPKISELLGLPENLVLSCVVALGYPAEQPKEVKVTDGNIKYYLNEENTLCVPKRDLEDVIIKIYD